jgi:alpha/beta superfamily hydrolase
MAHGYAGTKYHGIEPMAEAFAEAGFVVLLHDHRGFGDSGGEPRQDINPWQQITDWLSSGSGRGQSMAISHTSDSIARACLTATRVGVSVQSLEPKDSTTKDPCVQPGGSYGHHH